MPKSSESTPKKVAPAERTFWLRRVEWILFGLITLGAAALHLVLLFNVGALWRDEVNSVELSRMASLKEVWANLQFDSFPMLWFVLLRGWAALGLTSDMGYRILGCLIGLGILATIWWNGRQFGFSFPLFSLCWFAVQPVVIRFGDSIRAYGLGILLFLLTFGLVWRVTQKAGWKNWMLAAVAAVASVHAYYQNAVFLLAIGMAGALVFARRKQMKAAVMLLAIGLLAALSMWPYVSTMEKAKAWNMVMQLPHFDFDWFYKKFSEATGKEMLPVWLMVLALAVLAGIWVQVRREFTDQQKDAALFGVTVLLVGATGFYVFLKTLNYFTQVWYYAALMALIAVTADVIFSVLPQPKFCRLARMAIAVVMVAVVVPTTWPALNLRYTNVDLVASKLAEEGRKGDLILIYHWYNGITFQR